MLALVALFAIATPASEAARLDAHFATVDTELRVADVSALTEAQRVRRVEVIRELARYREAAAYPRNLSLDHTAPFFIDDRGVRCAMAHLIETHGGAAFVARVAMTANNAYVRDLAADADLRAWLEQHGLTLAEAARIQPSYPVMVGERCSALHWCVASTCTPTFDTPKLSYCSIACEPGGEPCPIGVEDIPMECQRRGDGFMCVYPEPSPGSIGWPCDPATGGSCPNACVAYDNEDGGICTPWCSNSQACPFGLVCEPLREDSRADYLRNCVPEDHGGCMAVTPPSWVLLLVVPLILGSASRTRQARRRTCAPPSPTDQRTGS